MQARLVGKTAPRLATGAPAKGALPSATALRRCHYQVPHLIKVTLSGPGQDAVYAAAQQLHAALSSVLPKSCLISCPGEGAWNRIKDDWRQVFLIKCHNPVSISPLLARAKKQVQRPSLMVDFDVDCLHIG